MKHHYPFIDGLRALAVLPVILFNYNLAHVTGGYVGIDVFFVLAGFLITGVIFSQMKEGRFSLSHFYERRARHIMPALTVTCVLSFVAAWLFYLPHDFTPFARSLEGVAWFGANVIFARSGYFVDPLTAAPLLHTWALAVGVQFYILFPLAVLALSRFKNRLLAVRFGFYALFVISFVLSIVLLHTQPSATFYLLPTRVWELMAGALLALHLKELRLTQSGAEMMSWLGLVILLPCFFLYNSVTPFPGLAAVPPVLATVFLVWANMSHTTTVKKIVSSKLLAGIGLVSYGLYLYHWPLLVFDRYYFDQQPTGLHAALLIALTFCIALLSYVYIESPVREGKILKKKSVFVVSVVVLAAIGLAGVAGVRSNGFPSRLSEAALKYEHAGGGNFAPQTPVCETLTAPGVSGEQVCKFGAAPAAHPDFLVWGDSHAAALSAPVMTGAIKHQLTGWSLAHNGCPPLVDADRMDVKDYSCPAISEAVLDLIQRNGIRNVVLVARWDMYALGWEKGSVETGAEPLISVTLPDGRILTGRDAFAASFKNTVATLDAMGVMVWVVKQVPPQLAYVSSAMAKAQFLGHNPDYLQRNYTDILQRRSFIDGVFADAAKASPLLHVIDPVDKFCPDKKTCLIAADGQPLYMDNTQLSPYGAVWSGDMLDPFFNVLQPQQK